MSERAGVLRDADAVYGELRESFEGLTDDQMNQVWLGTWGVREILIHIAGWHRAMIPALAHIGRGEAPFPAGTYDDYDAWNARFVEAKSGVKGADVVAELEASHRDFVAAAAVLPPALLAEGGAARELFDGVGPGHYREHTAQIRQWRAGHRG
jgi:hypothetical protein